MHFISLLRGPTVLARKMLQGVGFDIVRYPPLSRRAILEAEISRLTRNTVTAGPFAGMLLPEVVWGDRGSKLLGYYEEELHPLVSSITEWGPDIIVDVGCAEGYYAVGLAKLNPLARVFAYDVDPFAEKACRLNGKVNHLSNLEVLSLCTPNGLRERTERAKRAFVFIDCEGGERDLLLETDYTFNNVRMVIECHDFIDRRVTDDLKTRFDKTHSIHTVTQGGRNPFSHTLTAGWAESDLWTIVSENRPERMHWLYLVPTELKD
jgi:hypothetical protein